jgi:hypothetical protein
MDQRRDPRADEEFHELIEQLAGDGCCPLCREPYSPEGVQVVRLNAQGASQPHNRRWTLTVKCHCCGAGSTITADGAQPVSSTHQSTGSPADYAPAATGSSGELTTHELTPAEVLLFADSSPLSIDDVLDVHVFLREYRGSLRDL